MANTGSPSGRGGARRRCGAITRGDLLTFLLAATLCYASYCLGIWHNSRGAAGGSVLGPSAGLAGAASCGGEARRVADEPLDFVAHHTAESAGLSVSAVKTTTVTTTRRELRGDAPGSKGYRDASPRPVSSGVAWAAAGKSWAARFDGDSLRFTGAGAVRA